MDRSERIAYLCFLVFRGWAEVNREKKPEPRVPVAVVPVAVW